MKENLALVIEWLITGTVSVHNCKTVLWSQIHDRVADCLWSRLHSYWLPWALMSFGYTWLWSWRPWSLLMFSYVTDHGSWQQR